MVIGNDTELLPAGISTGALTWANGSLLVAVTLTPPAGAAPLRVTVAVAELPDTTVAGLTDKLARIAEVIFSVASAEDPLSEATISGETVDVTGIVATENVTLVAPAGTVIGPETLAAELVEPTETLSPPDGAAPVIERVAVDAVPPVTEAGESVIDFGVGAVILSVVVHLVLPVVAEIVGVTLEATGAVFSVNVAVEALAGTLTLAGTVAAALLLPSVTVIPPVGAGEESVTLPLALPPPSTVPGETETAETDCPNAAEVRRAAKRPTRAITQTNL